MKNSELVSNGSYETFLPFLISKCPCVRQQMSGRQMSDINFKTHCHLSHARWLKAILCVFISPPCYGEKVSKILDCFSRDCMRFAQPPPQPSIKSGALTPTGASKDPATFSSGSDLTPVTLKPSQVPDSATLSQQLGGPNE